MSKLTNILGVALIGLVIAIAGLFGSQYVKYSNLGVTTETKIKMVYDNNKVILNSHTNKVQEMAQVPEMYKNDLQEVIKNTFEGRYGENGSQAVFQFIKEQNLQLDPTLYQQLQQVMESGRNDFKTSQQQLVDVTRNYEATLDYVWSGFWLKLVGYPKINLNDYKILTTDAIDAKFASGKDGVIKLGGNSGS